MDLSRRSTLALAGAGATTLALPLPIGLAPAPSVAAADGAPSQAADDDPYETLLARAAEQPTGGTFDPEDPDFAAALGKLDAEATGWWQQPDTSAGHFWAADTVRGLAADGPATVLVRRRPGGIEVAVADPGRTATDPTVELPFRVRQVIRADDTVTVRAGRRPVLTVRVGGSRGHTHTAQLA